MASTTKKSKKTPTTKRGSKATTKTSSKKKTSTKSFKKSRFQKGSGKYICTCCGEPTRETGDSESLLGLCADCHYNAGLENEHQDGQHDEERHPDCVWCKEKKDTNAKRKRVENAENPGKSVSVKIALSLLETGKSALIRRDHLPSLKRRCEKRGITIKETKYKRGLRLIEVDGPLPEKKTKKIKHEKSEGHKASVTTSKKTKTVSTITSISAELIERWKNGEKLNDLAPLANLKRNKFRRELTKAVGGKAQYAALREKGAGGKSEPFGGRRSRKQKPGENDAVHLLPIDDGVPIIETTKHADGWRSRIQYIGAGTSKVSVNVFTSPEGVEYVRAKAQEKADLIFTPTGKLSEGLDPVRLRKLETSSVARQVQKEKKLVDQGQKAHARKREEKKAKRVKRKVGSK